MIMIIMTMMIIIIIIINIGGCCGSNDSNKYNPQILSNVYLYIEMIII
jgi:uncharacterized membrane protein YhaH (DUF805 family)